MTWRWWTICLFRYQIHREIVKVGNLITWREGENCLQFKMYWWFGRVPLPYYWPWNCLCWSCLEQLGHHLAGYRNMFYMGLPLEAIQKLQLAQPRKFSWLKCWQINPTNTGYLLFWNCCIAYQSASKFNSKH